MTTQQERIGGYRDALPGAGLPLGHALVFETMPTREGGKAASSRRSPQARRRPRLLCYNDIVAMGATRALAHARPRSRASTWPSSASTISPRPSTTRRR